MLKEESSPVLERGKERVLKALDEGVSQAKLDDPDVEFLSFPVARIIVEIVGDNFLRHRFAVAEAKRAHNLFKEEEEEILLGIATQTFGINCRNVRKNIGGRIYTFEVHFTDYLRYASGFHDPYWKLVNKILSRGYVLLVKEDFTRILSSCIERRLSEPREPPTRIPQKLKEVVSEVAMRVAARREKYALMEIEGEGGVVEEAFPPCISSLLSALRKSQPLSHNARFALTSFLIHVGYPVEKIVSLFSDVPDFKEELTRYQVEHIAGMRSGTRYTPPKCETMRTYGLCLSNEKCGRVRHPLEYYRGHKRRHSKGAES